MSHIQKWFERIAGYTQEERERREFAKRIFSGRQFDCAALSKPACWRRKSSAGFLAGHR